MIELTEHQVDVLTLLSNNKKQFASYASNSEDSPDAARVINQRFAEQMFLVSWGLCVDITARPGFQKISDAYMKEENRVLRVITATEMTKIMFKRQKKTVN
jgi:hypothetical protein